MELKAYDMNLKVLRAGCYDGYEMPADMQMMPRVCYDYELEYYIDSEGAILCDGKRIPVFPGEVNIRKPGQVVQGVNPYKCYIVCFHAAGGERSPDYVFGTPQASQPRYDNALLSRLPFKLWVADPKRIAALFEQIYLAFLHPDELHVFQANQLLYELLGTLFRQVLDEKSGGVHPRVMQAVRDIRRSFSDPLDVRRLVDESGLSRAYFHKCFKQCVGCTPLELQRSLRMEKAKELLCLTSSPVAEVASACGYDDPVYFTHLFKRQTGQTPTQYRRGRTITGLVI